MAVVRSGLHDILMTGVQAGASDWHIRQDSTVGLRIDGTLGEVDFVTEQQFLETSLREITTEALLEEYDKTGDADFAFEEEDVGRFRVNLHKQRGLMSLTLRHVKGTVPPIEALGLPSVVHRVAEAPRGIIIIAGTTGSGKSTTMACMIEHMNATMAHHIVTIENPIEYAFKDNKCIIEQREVGLDAISFESALVHVLRQDPDVIVIGEMRDYETIKIALTAAETGVFVLSTLHIISIDKIIERLLSYAPPDEEMHLRYLLSDCLQAVIHQELVPTVDGDKRVACEVLIVTDAAKNIIRRRGAYLLRNVITSGRKHNMINMVDGVHHLLEEGVITEDAANGILVNYRS